MGGEGSEGSGTPPAASAGRGLLRGPEEEGCHAEVPVLLQPLRESGGLLGFGAWVANRLNLNFDFFKIFELPPYLELSNLQRA